MTSPPSIRDQHRDLTRQTIVSAALQAFGDRTYSSTTIADIVARAGVSRATFYLHFASKEDVLRALRDERADSSVSLFGRLGDVLVAGSGIRFRAWILDFLHWLDANLVYVEAVTEIIAARHPDAHALTHVWKQVEAASAYIDAQPEGLRELARVRITRLIDDIWTSSRIDRRQGYVVDRDLLVHDLHRGWCVVFDIDGSAP